MFIGSGFILIAKAWHELYAAQRSGRLTIAGPYASIRHPQYVGFMLIMFGFLVQWPTLVTLVMFPILVTVYARLAKREERELLEQFGEEYARYSVVTPAFVPRFRRGVPRGPVAHDDLTSSGPGAPEARG